MKKARVSRKKPSPPIKDWFRLKLGALIFLILLFLPGQNVYERSYFQKTKVVAEVPFPLPVLPAPYPVNVTGFPPQGLTAEGILVVDLPSGIILYERSADLRLPPASTTKIMTALVALEHFNLDQVLTVKTVETRGRVMKLISQEKLTVENLLYGTLVHSANDAALTLAENYPGGVNAFVAKMNEEAKRLSLKNTHFENPIGFEASGQYSSAFDLFRLTTYVLQNKTFAKIVGTPSITVHDQDFQYFHFLENVNELLGKVPGVAGIKTGFTENAGECLINLTKKEKRQILTVVLKSEDRFEETQKILDWVFLNHRWEEVSPPGLYTTPAPAPT